MKIVIIGATGMLGHKMTQVLSNNFEVHAVYRSSLDYFTEKNIISHKNVDVKNFDSLSQLISNINPDFVLNCVGIIKQIKDKEDHELINSYLPNFLSKNIPSKTKLIHFSTDCVFSGKDGNYTEKSLTDAKDSYGISKRKGEPKASNTLVIRTSIIGHEIGKKISLVSWFMNEKSEVKGFSNAIFSGFSTLKLSQIINEIILNDYFKPGLFHLATKPINKYELLCLINNQYELNKKIIIDTKFHCNRSLVPELFKKEFFDYYYPWDEIILEMHQDYIRYFKLYN